MSETYTSLSSKLTGRCKSRRKLTHNTYAERRDETTIAVKLHATDVLTFHEDGRVVLNTGGWLTVTTKDRINTFGPSWLTVNSVKGRWMVTLFGDWDHPVPYADGMTLIDGEVIDGAESAAVVAEQDARNAETSRRISAFLRSLTPAQVVIALTDMAGDCIPCQFALDEPTHLEHHLAEHYLPGTLIWNAVKARGYRSPEVIVSMIVSDARRGQIDRTLTDCLRRYLRPRLVVGAVATIGDHRAVSA